MSYARKEEHILTTSGTEDVVSIEANIKNYNNRINELGFYYDPHENVQLTIEQTDNIISRKDRPHVLCGSYAKKSDQFTIEIQCTSNEGNIFYSQMVWDNETNNETSNGYIEKSSNKWKTVKKIELIECSDHSDSYCGNPNDLSPSLIAREKGGVVFAGDIHEAANAVLINVPFFFPFTPEMRNNYELKGSRISREEFWKKIMGQVNAIKLKS
ncbi:MAG: hypothetical protein HQ530_05050 [Parcubacteria group bacterium]|nr:hypothetical protein [Parcubacteria group bacterium]